MYRDRDFDARSPAPIPFAQDLELDVLTTAAAGGDRYIIDVMTAAFAQAWVNDAATIRYRQEVLADCIANPSVVRQFYAIIVEPFSRGQSWNYSLFGRVPSAKVASGVRTLLGCLDILARLRRACLANAGRFRSSGFAQLFATLERELDDDYQKAARADLDNLTFRRGLLLSATVGDGGKGSDAMLRKPQRRNRGWAARLLSPVDRGYTLQLAPRDDAGAEAFGELKGRGLGLVADAVYGSAEHTLGFLKTLRSELAFYLGCLNLKERLDEVGEPVTFPTPHEEAWRFDCHNLRDVCLALTVGRPVVGNDVDADGRSLVVITGANRGGKSTFLRSVGLAQLMLQCGLFVTADSFASSLRTGLFTHFKREEDRSMRSGKFDEELVRMSSIADMVHRRALVLFNESFAATNEHEGAEVARQIVAALREGGVTVFFVTHMYELARSFLDDEAVLFLRAERAESGGRSFRLVVATPQPRTFAIDLYRRIFGAEA